MEEGDAASIAKQEHERERNRWDAVMAATPRTDWQ
jgi:hypothetical protein